MSRERTDIYRPLQRDIDSALHRVGISAHNGKFTTRLDLVIRLLAERDRLRAAATPIVDGLVYVSLHGGEMATLDLSKLNALSAALEGLG